MAVGRYTSHGHYGYLGASSLPCRAQNAEARAESIRFLLTRCRTATVDAEGAASLEGV